MIVDDLRKSILDYLLYGKFITRNLSKIKKNFHIDSSEFPTTWKLVQIGSVIDIARGGSPRPIKSFLTAAEDGINWIKIGDTIKGSKYINSCEEKIIPEGISKSRLVHKGDFLLSNSMSFGRPYILNIDGCIHDGWLVLTDKNEFFLKDYLFYVLSSDFVYKQFSDKASGAVVNNLNTDKVRETIIPLPPIEEQQRIVNKIEELFIKLDEIKPIEAELISMKTNLPKELNKSIIDYAIHGYLSNQSQSDSNVLNIIPNRNTCLENYQKFNLELNENEHPFSIPENWKWVKLGMLFNYQNGYAYKPSETSNNGIGIPVIKSQNIMKRIVEINGKTAFVENPSEQMLKSKVIKGDFLMCLSSQSNNPEPLGKTAIYNEEGYALLNQRVLKLTPINKDLSKYLYYVINSFYFHNTVSHKGGGSAQSNLKLEHVMEMYIPLPPIEEQQRIVNKIEQLLPLCNDIENLIKSE